MSPRLYVTLPLYLCSPILQCILCNYQLRELYSPQYTTSGVMLAKRGGYSSFGWSHTDRPVHFSIQDCRNNEDDLIIILIYDRNKVDLCSRHDSINTRH